MKLFIGVKALIKYEGKVLILREAAYDEGTNEGKWDVPGGRINPEEPILEGLKREVTEESQLVIETEEVLGVFETFPEIKGESCHVVRVFYRAKAITTNVVLSGDHDLYEWVSLEGLSGKQFVSSLEPLIRRVLST